MHVFARPAAELAAVAGQRASPFGRIARNLASPQGKEEGRLRTAAFTVRAAGSMAAMMKWGNLTVAQAHPRQRP